MVNYWSINNHYCPSNATHCDVALKITSDDAMLRNEIHFHRSNKMEISGKIERK